MPCSAVDASSRAIGAVGGYIIRDIIIQVSPALAENQHFAFAWLGIAILALICGCLGSWLKDLVYAVATISVGSFGFATFVVGLVSTLGGTPLGTAAFIAIMAASAALGALVQYCLAQRSKKGKDEKKEPLVDK